MQTMTTHYQEDYTSLLKKLFNPCLSGRCWAWWRTLDNGIQSVNRRRCGEFDVIVDMSSSSVGTSSKGITEQPLSDEPGYSVRTCFRF